MAQLPIRLVPGTSPPQFEWRQLVTSPAGTTSVKHRGEVAPSMEQALRELVELAGDLHQENERLAKENEELRKGKPAKAKV